MFSDCEVISVYSRQDALNDGALIDVSSVAKEAGFSVPVALTRAVYHDYVEWNKGVPNYGRALQDEDGRLWDVLYMARHAVQFARDKAEIVYSLHVVPREGADVSPQFVRLKMAISSGDSGEPVITILNCDED